MVDIRSISVEEVPAFVKAMTGPFAFDLPDEEEERSAMLGRFGQIFEHRRARCAFDGAVMVGTLGAFSLDLTVPGNRVACAGTTMVTVQASHRRRGVLRALMDAHLEEAHQNGDAIAALWASDSAIYRRFGFGMASVDTTIEIGRPHVSFGRLAPAPDTVTVVDADTAASVFPPFFDAVRGDSPGFYGRSDAWWTNRRLRDAPDSRNGRSKYRFAITGSPDHVTGYVQFRVKEGWEDEHGAHQVQVIELIGSTPESWAGLWAFVTAHDLAAEIKAVHRSEDDPLFDFLAAPRRARRVAGDGLWVRLLDVPAALEARRYRSPGRLTLEVHDPMDRVSGIYSLETDESGAAECRPSTDRADLELDLEDLGACYLGRSRFAALSRAGRLNGSMDALRTADVMFGWDRAPWCPEVF